MSPAFIPPLRDLAARLTIPQAQAICNEVLRQRTAAAIMELMDGYVKDISPHLVPLLKT